MTEPWISILGIAGIAWALWLFTRPVDLTGMMCDYYGLSLDEELEVREQYAREDAEREAARSKAV